MNLLESIESINTNLSKIKAYQVLIFYESFGIQDALYFIIVYQLLKFVTNHKRLTDSSLAVKICKIDNLVPIFLDIILSYLIERVTFEMVSKWNHSYYEINFKTLIKIQR